VILTENLTLGSLWYSPSLTFSLEVARVSCQGKLLTNNSSPVYLHHSKYTSVTW